MPWAFLPHPTTDRLRRLPRPHSTVQRGGGVLLFHLLVDHREARRFPPPVPLPWGWTSMVSSRRDAPEGSKAAAQAKTKDTIPKKRQESPASGRLRLRLFLPFPRHQVENEGPWRGRRPSGLLGRRWIWGRSGKPTARPWHLPLLPWRQRALARAFVASIVVVLAGRTTCGVFPTPPLPRRRTPHHHYFSTPHPKWSTERTGRKPDPFLLPRKEPPSAARCSRWTRPLSHRLPLSLHPETSAWARAATYWEGCVGWMGPSTTHATRARRKPEGEGGKASDGRPNGAMAGSPPPAGGGDEEEKEKKEKDAVGGGRGAPPPPPLWSRGREGEERIFSRYPPARERVDCTGRQAFPPHWTPVRGPQRLPSSVPHRPHRFRRFPVHLLPSARPTPRMRTKVQKRSGTRWRRRGRRRSWSPPFFVPRMVGRAIRTRRRCHSGSSAAGAGADGVPRGLLEAPIPVEGQKRGKDCGWGWWKGSPTRTKTPRGTSVAVSRTRMAKGPPHRHTRTPDAGKGRFLLGHFFSLRRHPPTRRLSRPFSAFPSWGVVGVPVGRREGGRAGGGGDGAAAAGLWPPTPTRTTPMGKPRQEAKPSARSRSEAPTPARGRGTRGRWCP